MIGFSRFRYWPPLTIALLTAGLVSEAHPQRPAPQRHVIVINHFQNTPESLKVHTGDTVIWLNRDIVPHTVTGAGGAFDSGQIAPGKSWKLVTSTPGIFHYICSLHPNMHGTLSIE